MTIGATAVAGGIMKNPGRVVTRMKRLIGLCLVVVAGGCQADNDQSLAVVEEKVPSL
jgi:Ni,Fe-hydrogenase III small subunit